ncbi:MAG: hypothetical protein JSV60_05435 [Desulfobacterales bacterium]|nr:MAG: hypothetical protein JSV60_05435 [Desulfobacterales bacterium]
MDRAGRIVRILASTIAALLSATFVFWYNAIKTNNARWQGIQLPSLTAFYEWASPYGIAVPAGILLTGIVCLRLTARQDLVVNVVSYLGWLYALAWPLGCIFAWEVPYVIIGPGIK